MNFHTRKSLLEGLGQDEYELASQKLLQVGFDINTLKSTLLFGNDKRVVDGILTAIQPNNTGFSGTVSMVDYGNLKGGRIMRKT